MGGTLDLCAVDLNSVFPSASCDASPHSRIVLPGRIREPMDPGLGNDLKPGFLGTRTGLLVRPIDFY